MINHVYRGDSYARLKRLYNDGYRGAGLQPSGRWSGRRARSVIAQYDPGHSYKFWMNGELVGDVPAF